MRREIPAALEHEVSRALEKNPEKRQENFRGLIGVLRSLQLGAHKYNVSAEHMYSAADTGMEKAECSSGTSVAIC